MTSQDRLGTLLTGSFWAVAGVARCGEVDELDAWTAAQEPLERACFGCTARH